MSTIQAQLSLRFPPQLVTELLAAHEEARRNFLLGGLRLSAVEGGRFCEAAFRLLEHATTAAHTAIGRPLDTERLIRTLSNLTHGSFPDSLRLHIPRALRLVYDIRNQRDAAHLADGIDPNLQDGTLVVAVLNWVLAEFVRLYHNVSADEAHVIVDALATRQAPIVQDFNGALKVLNPNLGASEHCLVLLYHRAGKGATLKELKAWVRPKMRANIGRTLAGLCDDKGLAHFDGTSYQITQLGEQEVERRRLLER